jgi:hypothetical protein
LFDSRAARLAEPSVRISLGDDNLEPCATFRGGSPDESPSARFADSFHQREAYTVAAAGIGGGAFWQAWSVVRKDKGHGSVLTQDIDVQSAFAHMQVGVADEIMAQNRQRLSVDPD